MDITAGIRSQIKQLKDRLKSLNPAKHKPSEIQSLMGDLEALESRYEKDKSKRDEKRKSKEEAAKPVEVAKEAVVEPVASTEKEAGPKCALCGGTEFADYAAYTAHREKDHGAQKSYTPMDPAKKKEVTKTFEDKMGPAIIGTDIVHPSDMEKEGKFDIDAVVEPTRGTPGSHGRVMRHDSPKDLVYVMWEQGPMKDREQFGGYYPQDLKKKSVSPHNSGSDKRCIECDAWREKETNVIKSDLRSNYDALLKDLKDERDLHYTQGNMAWVTRLDQKITELEQKINEKYPSEKEASEENGSGGTSRLTVKDFTTTDSNSSAKSQEGSDPNDGYAGMWAEPDGRDLEAAPGAPGTLFTAQTAPEVANRLKSEIAAPYVNPTVSTLGGEQNVSIMMTVSADPKESWSNGILHNSRYGMFAIHNNGVVEHHSGSFNRIDEPRMNFRKRTVKSVDQLIQVINQHIEQVQAAHPEAPKTASQKTAKRYDIVDKDGNKMMSVRSEKELSMDQLSQIFATESKKKSATAKLIEPIAFLKAGERVTIVGFDKARGRVKFSSKEHSVKGWAPMSKFALDAQTVKHGDHDDKVLGATGSETLIDCSASGPTWVSSTELMDANRPPATPEALHEEPVIEEEASKECSDCHGTFEGAEGEKCPTCGRFSVNKESLKKQLPPVLQNQRTDVDPQPPVELQQIPAQASVEKKAEILDAEELDLYTENERDLYPQFLANVEAVKEMLAGGAYSPEQAMQYWVEWYTQGAEKYVSEFPDYEIDPQAIQDAAAKQEPYVKQAVESGEYGDVAATPNRAVDLQKLPTMDVAKAKDDLLDQINKETDPAKRESLERRMKHLMMASLHTVAELKKKATITHRKDGWHVLSESGKNLGGPYKTKPEAAKRLRQVEYFKHNGSMGLSKKEIIAGDVIDQALETQVQSLRDRMSAVTEVLQTNTLPKQAGEGDTDNSNIQLPELVEDLAMGLDLLETKLGQKDADPELSAAIEQMESLLMTLEKECGIESKPNEAHRPDEMEVELESAQKETNWPLCSVDGCKNKADSVGTEDSKRYCYTHSWGHKQKMKEAAVQSATTTTITNAPAAPSSPAPVTSTNPTATTPATQPVCALCGGQSFADYAAYQNHMEYTHASDTMPTTPSQKNLSTTVGGLKTADQVTDETITTNDPNAVFPDPNALPTDPVIKNVQPTDNDNLEIPVAMPSSPPSPGQKWVFDTENNVYVSMPDPTARNNPSL